MCCKGDTIWLAFNRKDGMPLEVFKGSSEIRRNIDSWEHRKSLHTKNKGAILAQILVLNLVPRIRMSTGLLTYPQC